MTSKKITAAQRRAALLRVWTAEAFSNFRKLSREEACALGWGGTKVGYANHEWDPNRRNAWRLSRPRAYDEAAPLIGPLDGVSVNGIGIGGEYAQLHANDCASDLRRALGMPDEST